MIPSSPSLCFLPDCLFLIPRLVLGTNWHENSQVFSAHPSLPAPPGHGLPRRGPCPGGVLLSTDYDYLAYPSITAYSQHTPSITSRSIIPHHKGSITGSGVTPATRTASKKGRRMDTVRACSPRPPYILSPQPAAASE